jgi:hypothetical protein
MHGRRRSSCSLNSLIFAAISAGGFAKPMARDNARSIAQRARQDAHNLPIGNFD